MGGQRAGGTGECFEAAPQKLGCEQKAKPASGTRGGGVGGWRLVLGGSVLLGTQGRLEHISVPRAGALGAQSQQRETSGELGRAGRGPFSLMGFRVGEEGAPPEMSAGREGLTRPEAV